MPARLFTTVLLWTILATTVIFAGMHGTKILLLLVSAGVLLELLLILQKAQVRVIPAPIILSLLLAMGAHLWGSHSIASVATSLALIIIVASHWNSPTNVLPIALGSTLIVALGLGSLYGISQLPQPNALWKAVWVIGVIKISDAGAYLFGTHFGRTKLAPSISPAKSVEGLVGAIICGFLIGVMGAPLFNNFWFALILAPILSLAGCAGDLAESYLKRKAKVKDSGKLLPGIGGLLDLCDSLIFAGPMAYVAIKYLN